MEGALVVAGGARTASEHCRGALEQVTEPTNTHTGPCDELATHAGVDLPSPHVHPHGDPQREKVVKKKQHPFSYILL